MAKSIIQKIYPALICFLLPGTVPAGIAIDRVGQKVAVPEYLGRVAPLAPSITEIVYDHGRVKKRGGLFFLKERRQFKTGNPGAVPPGNLFNKHTAAGCRLLPPSLGRVAGLPPVAPAPDKYISREE